MRVCFISGSYPPMLCGIGDFVQQLAKKLSEEGVHIDILTSKGEIIHQVGEGVNVWPEVQTWNLIALPAILAKLQAIRPDLVNIQYPTQRYGRHPMVNLLPAFIRILLRIPAVTTIHEFTTYSRLGRLRVGLSILDSSRVIIPDPANFTAIEHAYPASRSKLHYVPLGANIGPQAGAFLDRSRSRESLGAGQDEIVIAYFGFISPSKGIEFLLRAFRSLLEKHSGCPIRLLLIAGREPADPSYRTYFHQVEAELEALDLDSLVHWTGHLSPAGVSAALASADIAVLPFRDGASLRRTTLLSALAHGLPVISTRTSPGGSGEFEATGIVHLVPAEDEQALADAMLSLIQDGARRSALSARAAEFARSFAWPQVALRTLAVYRLALGGDHADLH